MDFVVDSDKERVYEEFSKYSMLLFCTISLVLKDSSKKDDITAVSDNLYQVSKTKLNSEG